MLNKGAKGYIRKYSYSEKFSHAVNTVMEKEFYHSELVAKHPVGLLKNDGKPCTPEFKMSEREHEFLQFACTELTYKEIADKMCVAERTVDGYRESLFNKLGVRTRVGLAMFAVRRGMVEG